MDQLTGGGGEPGGQLPDARDVKDAMGNNATLSKLGAVLKPREHRSDYLDAVKPRDPAMRKLAIGLTRKCKAADRGCEMNALLRHVARKIKYVSDPRGREHIQSVHTTLELGAGDCEDQSILLASMLEAVGIRTLMAFTEDHVYPMGCSEKPVARRYLGRGARVYTLPDGHVCYPLEATAPNSRVGQETDHDGFVLVIDPVTRKPIPMSRK